MKPFSSLLFFAFGLLLALSTCTQEKPDALAELTGVVDQIKNDQQHAFMKTMIPTLEDCQAIFTDEASAQRAFQYVEKRFATIDRVPDNAMKPLSEGATLVILEASKEDLLDGVTHELPEDYIQMAPFLRDGVKVYGIRYLDAAGQEEKTRTAFFRLADKWVFIPLPFAAFR